MERKNILLILIILLIAAGIFLIKRYFMGGSSDCQKLAYTISATNILVGEPVHFEDSSPQANDWKWDFGDGGKSDQQSGDYAYNNAGKYVITLLVNGKCTETATITVGDVVISSQDTTQKPVVVMGPSSAQVGEKVQFGNNTAGASNWEWQFGESGSNDSRDQNPSYTYNKPGTYTVVLRVDASKQEGRHQITVVNKPPVAAQGQAAPKPAQISEQELKAKFESILQGNFSDIYYDMLKKYFCNNDHIDVEINGEKHKGIYSYCMQLDIQRNTKISDVKITYDKSCISKVTVTQK